MTEIIATVGMVMNDRVTGTKYRIIYISNCNGTFTFQYEYESKLDACASKPFDRS